MELSSSLRGGIIAAASLQQHPATILYPKEGVWQPIVTQLPLLSSSTEIPKESIIANTDFNTTSLIAKRRLSSRKKRRQRRSAEIESPTAVTAAVTSTNNGPTPASNTSAAATTTSTQPISYPSPSPPQSVVPTVLCPSSVGSLTSSKQHPTASIVGATPIIPSGSSQCIPIGALPQHQVYSQVPPELVYRMSQPDASHGGRTTASSGSMGATPQQQQLHYVESSTGQHLTYSVPQPVTGSTQFKSSPTRPQIVDGQDMVAGSSAHLIEHQLNQQYHLQQQLQIHQQQQQQLAAAILHQQHHQHLYGIQAGLVSNAPVPLTDLHQVHLQGGVPVVGHASHPNQLIGVPIQTLYAPHHHVPMATTLAPPELLLQVQNGSWVAPTAVTPPMFGSCIINPIQPGLLATSLVK